MKKLIIKPITQITKKEQLELDNLKKKSKLTKEESFREVFLSVKCCWNCEC